MYEYIISDCIETTKYIPGAILISISVLIILSVRRYIINRSHGYSVSIINISDILLSVLLFYIVMLIQIALLSREPGSRIDVSVIIGETWSEDPQGRAYVIENILLFIPFGVIMYSILCSRRKELNGWGKIYKYMCFTAVYGIILSCIVEAIQYITGRGYLQIDDIIANTAGSLVGGLAAAVLLLIVHRVHTSGT